MNRLLLSNKGGTLWLRETIERLRYKRSQDPKRDPTGRLQKRARLEFIEPSRFKKYNLNRDCLHSLTVSFPTILAYNQWLQTAATKAKYKQQVALLDYSSHTRNVSVESFFLSENNIHVDRVEMMEKFKTLALECFDEWVKIGYEPPGTPQNAGSLSRLMSDVLSLVDQLRVYIRNER